MQAEHREVQLAADAQAEQQVADDAACLGVGVGGTGRRTTMMSKGCRQKRSSRAVSSGGNVGNLLAPAGMGCTLRFLVELRLVGQDDLGFQAGEAGCQICNACRL